MEFIYKKFNSLLNLLSTLRESGLLLKKMKSLINTVIRYNYVKIVYADIIRLKKMTIFLNNDLSHIHYSILLSVYLMLLSNWKESEWIL